MGAPVSIRDWWLWNQLPVTLGNLIGGFLFVGLPKLSMRSGKQRYQAQVVPFSDAEPKAAKA